MTSKLLTLLSLLLFSCSSAVRNADRGIELDVQQPTDCMKCYFMGQAYSIGGHNNAQTCVLGANKKGAVWVNNNAPVVPKETCMYCVLAGAWYSEGAINGTTNPVQYCTSGQWK